MLRRRLLHGRDGGVMILAVLCIVIMLGMAALAVDIGQMYMARQRAQNVCDASALAGVMLLTGKLECTYPTAEPYVAASNCIDANNEDADSWQLLGSSITFPTSVAFDNDPDNTISVESGEAIRVTGYVDVNFAFAGIFGFTSKQVSATATAILQPATRIALSEMIPIGFPPGAIDGLEFGDQPSFGTVGDWQDGSIGPGNWLSLKFEGDSGVNDYVNRLRGDEDPVVVSTGDMLHTQTGGAVGEGTGGSKTYEGLVGTFTGRGNLKTAGRLNLETNTDYAAVNTHTGYNPTAWDTWKDSKDPTTGLYDSTERIVILPVVEGTSSGSSTALEVVGFAAFFIVRVYDGNTPDANGVIRPIGDIEGHFIQAITGEQGNTAGWIFPVEGTEIEDPSGVMKYRLIS